MATRKGSRGGGSEKRGRAPDGSNSGTRRAPADASARQVRSKYSSKPEVRFDRDKHDSSLPPVTADPFDAFPRRDRDPGNPLEQETILSMGDEVRLPRPGSRPARKKELRGKTLRATEPMSDPLDLGDGHEIAGREGPARPEARASPMRTRPRKLK